MHRHSKTDVRVEPTPQVLQRARQLHESGLTLEIIAKRFERSPSTVKRWLDKARSPAGRRPSDEQVDHEP